MAIGVLIKDLPLYTTGLTNTDKLIVQNVSTHSLHLSSIREYNNSGEVHLSGLVNGQFGDAKHINYYFSNQIPSLTNGTANEVIFEETGNNRLSIPNNHVMFFYLKFFGTIYENSNYLGSLYFMRRGTFTNIDNTPAIPYFTNFGTDENLYNFTLQFQTLAGQFRFITTPNSVTANGKSAKFYGKMEGYLMKAL